MPHKHGGDGGFHNDILDVDADAVPGLRSAFADALSRVDRQLELAEKELTVSAWAKDPVSQGATTQFNDCSVLSPDSAVDRLRAYRTQLEVAVVNLDKTAEQYRATDHAVVHGVGTDNEG